MSGAVRDWRTRLRWELRAARRLFVLGVGNPDRADDGAGGLCVRLLQSGLARTDRRTTAEIQVLDGGEAPESTTGIIRKSRPTHVLIIDAASAGYTPGTVFFITKKRIPEGDLTTHRLPLAHLVRYLEESVGCRVILLGIEPQDLSLGRPMSSAVKRAAAEIADILSELRS